MRRVYLDNASTTPLDPAVLDAMLPFMKNFHGNPSSIHYYGRKVKAAIEDARARVAKILNASTGEIFFTSSATEATNMILVGAVKDLGVTRIISSPIEHHCVSHTLQYLKNSNLVTVEYLSVDQKGNADLNNLEEVLKSSKEKTLVSLMHANNEIGTMAELDQISRICNDYGALLHSDTVQTIGKFDINLKFTPINFICGSAHKFFGPKGVGFLYMKQETPFKPLLHGGGQERNMRAGTENVYGIIGIAKAFELAIENLENRRTKILSLRGKLLSGIHEIHEDIRINGNSESNYHYAILNLSFPNSTKTEMIMMNLDIAGISVSAGSACASGVEHESHVLQAIRAPENRNSVRFSFSHLNTMEDINYTLDQLRKIVLAQYAGI